LEEKGKILPVLIEDEMKRSYIDYAMSVIVGRALPDVRDGLKPVHRRILYSMWESGITHNKPYKKSARVVGDVLGKYHPHGDMAVYDALVRMAQPFSLRYTLIDGQGNFGSVDGDSAAAMRYTEVRLSKIAEEMLADIEKDTVDFVPNYDQSLEEPVVLPSRLPNLLVNGSTGIAVGMATNIPPHNLSEVCDAICALIDNPELTNRELMRYVKGPDFPTGGAVYGVDGIVSAYEHGRGTIRIRAIAEIEDNHIIISEIPYQVNKAKLVETIAELVRERKLDGISEVRDESDKEGIRVVVELRRDANPTVVLNNLYTHTQCEVSFGITNLALVDGVPRVLSLRDMLFYFIQHRKDVIRRRSLFELQEAERRAHIVDGLLIAIDNIDEVVAIIKSSKSVEMARNRLMETFSLTELQTNEILNMPLRRLTALERSKLEDERKDLLKRIEGLRELLSSEKKILEVVKREIQELKERYGDERRTIIMKKVGELKTEDLVADEKVVITITRAGYIKRTLLTTFRRQHRGGKGVSCVRLREGDYVILSHFTSNLQNLLLFTNRGRVFSLRAYEIPEGDRTSRGSSIAKLISLEKDEYIVDIISHRNDGEYVGEYVFVATKKGVVKKTHIKKFENAGKRGIIAIKLKGDEVAGARLTDGNKTILLATRNGMATTFSERDVRAMGRSARGVRGMNVKEDEVVGISLLDKEDILVISEKGYGKRIGIHEFRVKRRGGKGIRIARITDKSGGVAGVREVGVRDEVVFTTERGLLIRTSVSQVRRMHRSAKGVRIVNVSSDDRVVSISVVGGD
jgi:DNA gyrase subunit A